jgi:hypothetical protein
VCPGLGETSSIFRVEEKAAYPNKRKYGKKTELWQQCFHSLFSYICPLTSFGGTAYSFVPQQQAVGSFTSPSPNTQHSTTSPEHGNFEPNTLMFTQYVLATHN